MAIAPSSSGAPSPSEQVRASTIEQAIELISSRLEEIAVDLTESIAAVIPAMPTGPSGVEDNRAMVVLSLKRMRDGKVHDAEIAAEIARRARTWSTRFPLETLAAAFHIGARRLSELIAESAHELGWDAAQMFIVQDLAWDWGMFASSVFAELQREQAVSEARRDATRRAEFLRDLASGRIGAERLARETAIYGLDLNHSYYAVRAIADDGAWPALEARLRQSGATSNHRALLATVEGQLLAVAARHPGAFSEQATVACGHAVPLAKIHESFSEAGEVLAAAPAFGITGTVDLGSLGPKVLVTRGDRAAARLAERYFGGLGERFSDTEQTVLTLLDHDQSIDETAAVLHLHRNTVRYRVNRFREITGLDLRVTQDLVLAWWLLEWRRTSKSG
jgi:hypothetical protein